MRFSGHSSLLNEVADDGLFDVWRSNPNAMTRREAFARDDKDLHDFADELDEEFLIVDLRNASPGFGFTWGRFGEKTRVERFYEERIFAYAPSA